MPLRKFRWQKQFSVHHTYISRNVLNARNKRRRPKYWVPEVLQKAGVPIYDPNDPDFPRNIGARAHSSVAAAPEEEQIRKVLTYDGTAALSEGIEHALAIAHALPINELPPKLFSEQLPEHDRAAEYLKNGILQAHLFDPTLERLPRRHDPILWWLKYTPVLGVPEAKKYDIILNDLYRRCVQLNSASLPNLSLASTYRNLPLSVVRPATGDTPPISITVNPNIIVMHRHALTPIVDDRQMLEATKSQSIPDIYPVSHVVDFLKKPLLQERPFYPRCQEQTSKLSSEELPPLQLHTLFCSLEQESLKHQKYPWSQSAITGQAILQCYAGALAMAQNKYGMEPHVLNRPVVCQLIQMCRNYVDFVVFQLNTTDHTADGVKNMCWYSSPHKYHEYTVFWRKMDPATIQPNMDVYRNTLALLNNCEPSSKEKIVNQARKMKVKQ